MTLTSVGTSAGTSTRLRLVALAAGGFGLAVTPFLMAAWLSESDLYLVAGRMFFPAYVGAMAGMLLFRRRLTKRPVFWGRMAFWFTFMALAAGLVGDLGSYWAGPGNGGSIEFSRLQSIFFGTVEFPAIVLAQLGVTFYGFGLVWSGSVGTRAGWLVAALGPLGLLLWPLHIPGGPLFVMNLFWVVSAANRRNVS